MRLNLFVPRKKKSAAGLLGSSWRAAPVRRIVQVLCLAAFLVLLFYVARTGGAPAPAEALAGKELLPAETFLRLDPLVSVTAALAGRAWIVGLIWAAAVLAVGLVLPRWFCGYACPLGTLIDLSDWILRRKRRPRKRRPWWAYLRWVLLLAVLAGAAIGVMLAGYVAAIALLTRGLALAVGPLATGLTGKWAAPPMAIAAWAGAGMLLGVFLVSFLGARFWCRAVCPTGALLSAGAACRLTDREVSAACIACGQCVKMCPFDAINPDFSTRASDCTFCQTCGGVCPVNAISFVGRWDRGETPLPANHVGLTRRGFLAGGAAGVAVGLGAGAILARRAGADMIRPPGSLPEKEFLARCVRCGACINACPTGILQPAGLSGGVPSIWTPAGRPDWGGCDPKCNACGQVCPTGAIRALPLEEKHACHMGLAEVNHETCLEWSGREPCGKCIEACSVAGYDAVGYQEGEPEPFRPPMVLQYQCVGCGNCQEACHRVNVREKGLLNASAITVRAGGGKDDRIRRGSYRALRAKEKTASEPPPSSAPAGGDDYLPDLLK